jgi:hypothetical protein
MLAIGILLLNDHVLKGLFPGPMTGKLSDFAGLYFFPLALTTAWEMALEATGMRRGRSFGTLVAACGATATVFSLVKTDGTAATICGWILGFLQWGTVAPFRAFGGNPIGAPIPVTVVVDPSDLVALISVCLCMFVGYRSVFMPREDVRS